MNKYKKIIMRTLMFKNHFGKLFNIIMEQEAIDTVKSIEKSAQHIRSNYNKNETNDDVLNKFSNTLQDIDEKLNKVNSQIRTINRKDKIDKPNILNYLIHNYIYNDEDLSTKEGRNVYDQKISNSWNFMRGKLDKKISLDKGGNKQPYPTVKDILFQIFSPILRHQKIDLTTKMASFFGSHKKFFRLVLNKIETITGDSSIVEQIFKYTTQWKGIMSIGSGEYYLTIAYPNLRFSAQGGCDVTDGEHYFEVKNATKSSFAINTQKENGIYTWKLPIHDPTVDSNLYYIFFLRGKGENNQQGPIQYFIKKAKDVEDYLKFRQESEHPLKQSRQSGGGLGMNAEAAEELLDFPTNLVKLKEIHPSAKIQTLNKENTISNPTQI